MDAGSKSIKLASTKTDWDEHSYWSYSFPLYLTAKVTFILLGQMDNRQLGRDGEHGKTIGQIATDCKRRSLWSKIHLCAKRKTNNDVYACGSGYYGQLGLGEQ